MAGGKRIELSLGQEPGEFTLHLEGMAITIHMNNNDRRKADPEAGKGASEAPPPPSPEAGPGLSRAEVRDIEKLLAELERYQHFSQEIYEGLGKLAKDINLSIQDLSLAELIQNMGSPGEHLDQARSQVTDVLLMTEQATLNIMDLVEEIREDCQTVQAKLLSLTEAQGSPENEGIPAEAAPAGQGEEQSLWETLFSQVEAVEQVLYGGGEGEGEASSGPVLPSFSLSDILQVILEFCTNEKVKQHLRAVQSKQDAVFRGLEAEQALSLLAANAPQEEGFYQLPLNQVLGILHSHCEDERVKELFAKMASSAEKLFPVAALPLEAKGSEEASPEASPEYPGGPEAAARWDELRHTLKLLFERRQAAIAEGGSATGPQLGVLEAKTILDTVDHITKNLSRIIEALSFQDLSGQRLLKILKIIRQLQVQVLTLLVAAGDRLQARLEGGALDLKESDQAREELDRLLSSFAPSTAGGAAVTSPEQPLDQNAINELLTTMGF